MNRKTNMFPSYYSVYVMNDAGKIIFIDDYDRRSDAIRANIEWQEDGYKTEMFTLSDAPIFDTAPDDHTRDVDRLAY